MKMCSFARNIQACGVHPMVSCGVLPGLWLEIRLEMLSLVVSWFPPHGVWPGLWLEIRLEMLSLVVLWFPPHGVLPSLWLEIRLEMLSLVVSWFPPRGVVVSTPWCCGFHTVVSTLSSLVNGSKLDWKCCHLWCHGVHPMVLWFPPHGFHLV